MSCPLTKFVGGLNILHKVDDDPVIWLESTMTAALRVRSKLKGQNSSTFKGLEVFIPNSSIFKDFSSTLSTPSTRKITVPTIVHTGK